MNDGIDPFFYAFVCEAALWLALLWAGTRCGLGRCSPTLRMAFGLLTAALLLTPLDGLPLWNWAFSFVPNPSLPTVGMICGALAPRLFGRPVFTRGDWRAIVAFGALSGTVLYLHTLFAPGSDLYYWGWQHDIAIWSMAALALVAFATGFRAGILVLAALVAYEVQALESHNAWDYLVDPFFWLFSVIVGLLQAVRWGLARVTAHRAAVDQADGVMPAVVARDEAVGVVRSTRG